MPDKAVDIIKLSLGRASGALVTLEEVQDFNFTVQQSKTAVHTLNRARVARGFRKGAINVSGSITVPKFTNPEAPWQKILLSGEICQLYYRDDEAGERVHIVDVEVSDVGRGANPEGENNEDITFVAKSARFRDQEGA